MAQSEKSSGVLFNMIPFVLIVVTFLFLVLTHNYFLYSFFGLLAMALSMVVSKILYAPLNQKRDSAFILQQYEESVKFQTILFCFSLPYIFLMRRLLETRPDVPLFVCLYFTLITMIITGWAARTATKGTTYRYPFGIISGLYLIPFIVTLIMAWH